MKKLLKLYDLDHTLIFTKGKIYGTNPREPLSQETFDKKLKEKGYFDPNDFDFSEFKKISTKDINKATFELLLNDINNGHRCGILTARSDDKPVINFVDELKISVDVVAINTEKYYRNHNVHDSIKKAMYIATQISLGWHYIDFYDDSVSNLMEAQNLKEYFPQLELRTYFVCKENIELYEK